MRKKIFVLLLWVAFATPSVSSATADISRPFKDEGPTQVYVEIFVLDVDEINSASQSFDANVYVGLRWQDSRIAHGDKEKISKPLSEIWHPRIQILNQQKLWPTFPEMLEIKASGEVFYRQRLWGSFSQPLDLSEFPYDKQVFTIQLVATGYRPDEVELVQDPNTENGISKHLSVADWDILGWKMDSGSFKTSPGGEALSAISFTFEAMRRFGYYNIKLVIPLVFIVAMSWVVFWIDPTESGTQISVSITTMLTLIAYRFAVGVDLPKISYSTRLDYFILLATVLIFASLIEVICTSRLAKSGKIDLARRVDLWSSWLFPVIFALLALKTLAL